MTMINKEVFFDIETLLCVILRNPPLPCCDIKSTKTSVELGDKFSKLDNVFFHHIYPENGLKPLKWVKIRQNLKFPSQSQSLYSSEEISPLGNQSCSLLQMGTPGPAGGLLPWAGDEQPPCTREQPFLSAERLRLFDLVSKWSFPHPHFDIIVRNVNSNLTKSN